MKHYKKKYFNHFIPGALIYIGALLNKITKSQTLILIMVSGLLFTCCGSKDDPNRVLEGFWSPEKYILKTGESKNVTGHISFGRNHWSVVFFILDDNGRPVNASAEGGEYSLQNNNLTFYHDYNFSDVSKGDVSELRRSVSLLEDREKEFCSIEIEEDLLAIYFPSGNAMIFSRSTSQL